jgi:hypothetical protein
MLQAAALDGIGFTVPGDGESQSGASQFEKLLRPEAIRRLLAAALDPEAQGLKGSPAS